MRFKTNASQPGQPDRFAISLSLFLGCFSVLLGIIELAAARPLTRGLGLEDHGWIVPVYGLREIMTGVFIFISKDPTPWIWFRVAGDALDIGTVAFGYSRHIAYARNFVITFVALAGATALDIYCAMRLSNDSKIPLPLSKSGRAGNETGKKIIPDTYS